MHRVARKDHAQRRADQNRRKRIKEYRVKQGSVPLPVLRVGRFIRGNHGFILVANGEQLVFGHYVLAGCFHVILVDARLDDCIDRTGFLAKTTVDALEQVDVVASRPASSIFTDVRFNGYGERRAYRLAQVADRVR